ncbi:MAG: hypothetical protein V2I27_05225 [Erythrobacter sp.]|jgi:hypothetical protein|nr:hypothetical protein [Erythrobacter sp.]
MQIEMLVTFQPRFDTAPAPCLLTNAAAMAADGSLAGRFMAALCDEGIAAHVGNASSQPMLLRHGRHRLPVLAESGGYGDTYMTAPHSAYVLYARDELDIMGVTGVRRLAGEAALFMVDRALRAIRINRAVHLDNWLLSTSLHGEWDGEDLGAMRAVLCEAFPDRVIILRTLDEVTCPLLLEAARADGWTLLPARQIWITQDMARDWQVRSHVKRDRAALRKSGLSVELAETLSAADCERIAGLYHRLYHGRYSGHNPRYTAHFVELAARLGVLRFRVARDSAGRIMAASAMRIAGGVLTVPMIAYDMDRPQDEALYRIASYLSAELACEQGLIHHGSSGASTFKRHRGAVGVIEYMGVYARHLPRARQLGLSAFAAFLERTMVPTLMRQGW